MSEHNEKSGRTEMAAHWAEDATDRQVAYIKNLMAFRVVPGDLRDQIADAFERSMCKADAFTFIRALKALPNRHRQFEGAAVFVHPSDPTEAEVEEAKRFDYEMLQANGEEYPGQAEEILGAEWIQRHTSDRTD